MRQAFELAFITCGLFADKMPVFLIMDDVNFIRPVEAGSVLALTSKVVYTSTDTQDQEPNQKGKEPLLLIFNSKLCSLSSKMKKKKKREYLTTEALSADLNSGDEVPDPTFPLIQVQVKADVTGFRANSYQTTNTFHFTFRCANNKHRVVPDTYAGTLLLLMRSLSLAFLCWLLLIQSVFSAEGMEYLHGRRRIMKAKEMIKTLLHN